MIELTINFVLKFLHMTGLMLGAASGFGAMLLVRQSRQAGGPSSDIAALRPRFARLALIGITMIWVSGLGLWFFRYDMVDLGAPYRIKMFVSAALLAVILLITALSAKARKNNTPPPAWLPKLGMTTPVMLFTAMGLGVWIFI